MMFGLTIREFDERGVLSIELRDILQLLGRDAEQSIWRIEGVEALGENATRIHDVSHQIGTLVGSELARVASGLDQIVDGTFSAFKDGNDQPWVVIAAVDSSAYDVMTAELHVIWALKRAFESAEFIPGMEPSSVD
ncbi:MAG: hypothetical protein AAF432_10345 [Planctomycetota bacterium]